MLCTFTTLLVDRERSALHARSRHRCYKRSGMTGGSNQRPGTTFRNLPPVAEGPLCCLDFPSPSTSATRATNGIPDPRFWPGFTAAEETINLRAVRRRAHSLAPIHRRPTSASMHPFAAAPPSPGPATTMSGTSPGHIARRTQRRRCLPRLRSWGNLGEPIAWPHDCFNRDKGSGEPAAAQYRAHGINMSARSCDAGRVGPGVAGGVMTCRADAYRAASVFSRARLLVEEYRLYHRKDGLI